MSEVEESKITAEHRAMIGIKSDPIEVTPKAEDASRMRDLLGDKDARYSADTGMAPPYALAMLEPGLPPELSPRVLSSGILTQTEWKFMKPIQINETLSATTQVISIRDRLGGRYGYSVLVTFQTDYLDENGDAVAASLRTINQFDRGDE